jgi:hypothetical protein
MSSQFYDNALRESYRFAALTISGGAVVGSFIGPVGKKGKIVNVSSIVTTGVTVAAAGLTIGASGQTEPVAFSIPISSTGAGLAIPKANLKDATAPSLDAQELAADTVVEIEDDGLATAGAADIVVTVDWY